MKHSNQPNWTHMKNNTNADFPAGSVSREYLFLIRGVLMNDDVSDIKYLLHVEHTSSYYPLRVKPTHSDVISSIYYHIGHTN